jgi:hypothetical protein
VRAAHLALNIHFCNEGSFAMKTGICLWALILAVLWGGGAAWADDGFYVIAGGGGRVGTKITSLPYTITTPTLYYLGGNLTFSGSGNAITVNADNVTLDLMGCSLTYTGSGGHPNGIYMSGRNNVEIRNGTISGFCYGIHEASDDNGANHRVINIRADNNTTPYGGIGISLQGNNHLVRDCTASNNSSAGISVGSGTITGCVAYNNGVYNIILSGAGSLLDNIAINSTSNDTAGFSLSETSNTLVDGNSAQGNGTFNYFGGGPGTVWGVNAGH